MSKSERESALRNALITAQTAINRGMREVNIMGKVFDITYFTHDSGRFTYCGTDCGIRFAHGQVFYL